MMVDGVLFVCNVPWSWWIGRPGLIDYNIDCFKSALQKLFAPEGAVSEAGNGMPRISPQDSTG